MGAASLGCAVQGSASLRRRRDIGITPKVIEVAIGKHVLEFSKEGFNRGKFPLEITLARCFRGVSAMNLTVLRTTQSNSLPSP